MQDSAVVANFTMIFHVFLLSFAMPSLGKLFHPLCDGGMNEDDPCLGSQIYSF